LFGELDQRRPIGPFWSLGRIGIEVDKVAEIDINPLIVCGDTPVAVDALVVLKDPKTS
jgi:hypothetical protein